MKRHEMVQAGKRFLQALREADLDDNEQISLEEFKIAFQKKVIFKCFCAFIIRSPCNCTAELYVRDVHALRVQQNVRFSDNFRLGLVT